MGPHACYRCKPLPQKLGSGINTHVLVHGQRTRLQSLSLQSSQTRGGAVSSDSAHLAPCSSSTTCGCASVSLLLPSGRRTAVHRPKPNTQTHKEPDRRRWNQSPGYGKCHERRVTERRSQHSHSANCVVSSSDRCAARTPPPLKLKLNICIVHPRPLTQRFGRCRSCRA